MAKRQKMPTIQEDGSLIKRLLMAFEHARKLDDQGSEFWLAREYGAILGYTWEGFERVIERGEGSSRRRRRYHRGSFSTRVEIDTQPREAHAISATSN